MNGALEPMSWLAAQWGAAMVNSLLPGLLLGLAGWGVLRGLPRLNASTRFVLGLCLLVLLALLPGLLLVPVGQGAVARVTAAAGPAQSSLLPGWLEMSAALVWLAGSLLLAARLLLAGIDLVRLRRSCRPADAKLVDALQMPLQGRARRARICVSAEVSSPLAMGLWRPLVVLPEGLLETCAAEDVRRVLLHELEHIRRFDDWTHFLQQVGVAALFFQPAIWWLNRLLTEERESACDDAVLAATGEAKGYAVCLARLAEAGLDRRVPAWATAAVSRPSLLRRRMMRILENGRDVSGRLSRPALAASLTAVVVVLTAAARMPRLMTPQPMTWSWASLPALAPEWQAQRIAATQVEKARVDRRAEAVLRQVASRRAAAAAVSRPRAGRELAGAAVPAGVHAVRTPQATAWRVVEMQTVEWQWNGHQQVTTTRMVFVMTGPQEARWLQNPSPVLF